ncbi:MAG: protein jag [Chthonomonadales bacterium]
MTQQAQEGKDLPLSMEDLEPQQLHAVQILEEMFHAGGLNIQPVPVALHPPYVDIDLRGNDVPASFGRHGNWLDALQYLSNLIVLRRVGPEVRLVLDAGGYRARRAAILEELAKQYAQMVKERQEECELDPLPAHERRIIHNALLDDPDVRTYSEGDDPDRRVIIAPR